MERNVLRTERISPAPGWGKQDLPDGADRGGGQPRRSDENRSTLVFECFKNAHLDFFIIIFGHMYIAPQVPVVKNKNLIEFYF